MKSPGQISAKINNLIFVSLAAAVAYRCGLRHIVIGSSSATLPIFGDCREETFQALQCALNLGMERDFVLETPLMWLDKAAIWRLAVELGREVLVDLIVEQTHTCYRGEREQRHDWGYGCGTCPACETRAEGFAQFRKQRQFADAAE